MVFRIVKVLIIVAVFVTIANPVNAQSPATDTNPFTKSTGDATLGVARILDTKVKDPKDGSILSAGEAGAELSSISNDPQVLGVVARDAAIILANANSANGVPVISNGTVYVLVSSKTGGIKSGDLLTTSTIPGVAVKAVNSGYVLGYALENYENSDANATGLIAAELNLHYFNAKPTLAGTLSDIMKLIFYPTKEGANPILKYIVAALVVIASFILGFLSYGRTAAKGVEALGRNPAAKSIIQLGIMFNVGIVIVIILAGLTVAFLILKL
jgi:F0F1-type ATP synthase membrane subunit c/vacuolar-type H+-ATPase subunit K